jgi:ubiquinone/menaquinone biosynthesis C-methylase UbiE
MELKDAISLINKPGLSAKVSSWADLGAGSGLFTKALAGLLAPGSTVYAIDRAPGISAQTTGNGVKILPMQGDFTLGNPGVPLLDGILMANALHFVKEKPAFLKEIKQWIGRNGSLIIVEYDTKTGNRWVPYPIPFSELKGFTYINKIASVYQDAGIYGAYIELNQQ